MTNDLSKAENVLERVAFIIDEFEYTANEFAVLTGVSRTTAENIKTGKADPKFKLLTNIVKMLPVSKDWLFFGRGKPFTVDDISSCKKRNKKKYDPIDRKMNRRFAMVRGEADMTQPEFANELGVTKYTITNVETSKNGLNAVIVKKLMEVFNVNPIWFLTGSGNMYLDNKKILKDN